MALANLQMLEEVPVPPDVIGKLKQSHFQLSLHNMKILALLPQVKKIFDSGQVNWVLLKSPLLSHLLYNSFNLRFSYDLDLLVSPLEFPVADSLLREAGFACYEPVRAFSPRETRLYMQNRHHYSYRFPGHNLSLELHWSLAEPYYTDTDFSLACMRRARLEALPGLSVKTLSREDALVYAFVHGAKHRWASAKHLLDLLALLRLPGEWDWPQVGRSLGAGRLGRIAAQGLSLLEILWGYTAPPSLQAFAQPDAASRFLAGFSLDMLSWREAQKRRDPRWFLYGLLLKPGIAYPARYLSKILALPLLPR
jgi:hypothetical protein